MADPLNDFRKFDMEMPNFEPKRHDTPGVDPPVLTKKEQSVVDSFSVREQEIRWLAGKLSLMSGNMLVILSAVNDLREAFSNYTKLESEYSKSLKAQLEVAQKQLETKVDASDRSVDLRIKRLEQKPMRTLASIGKSVGTLALGFIAAWVWYKLTGIQAKP